MKNNAQNTQHSARVTQRVPARMEGVVRNIGIKPVKKPAKKDSK